jgi:curli production assembly/transport component CsgF
MNGIKRLTLILFVSCLAQKTCFGTEIMFQPVNPSFGGSPLNGPGLLSSAQATNKHLGPSTGGLGGSSIFNQSPLQQFNDTLERSVLNQLASSATSKIVGRDGKLEPGTVETGNFRISIVDIGGGNLRITTTDKVTGAATAFEVSQ